MAKRPKVARGHLCCCFSAGLALALDHTTPLAYPPLVELVETEAGTHGHLYIIDTSPIRGFDRLNRRMGLIPLLQASQDPCLLLLYPHTSVPKDDPDPPTTCKGDRPVAPTNHQDLMNPAAGLLSMTKSDLEARRRAVNIGAALGGQPLR